MKKNKIESSFLTKITTYSKKIGEELIFKSLLLFYALKSKKTPKWAKSTIISALTYLVFPLDTIPDFTPFVGYSDDLGVIIFALSVVYLYIDDDVVNKANLKFITIFGYDYKEKKNV